MTKTDPPRNATVADPPHAVTFFFNEPVEANSAAIRIYDADGARVDEGPIERPDGRSDAAGVHLSSAAGRGVYTATYRVVSADGHPVEGGLSFGIGVSLTAPGGPRPPQVAKLLEGGDPPASVEGTYGVVRGLHYLALLVAVGAAVFAAAVGAPRRRVVVTACAVGLVTSLLAVPLQGLLGTVGGLSDALDRAALDAALDTRTGAAWAIRAGIWGGAFMVALLARRNAVWLAFPAVALALSMPLGGHAWTQDPRAVLVSADVVHVIAAGVWLGGLLLLLAGRSSIAQTRAFSTLALPAIVAVAAAGGVQTWFYLGSPGDLVGDAYGVALLLKIIGLLAIVAFGARNRRALRGDSPETGARLRKTMRTEAIVALAIVAATATLVRLAPPAGGSEGPDYRNLDMGPLRLQMVIEPQRVGANTAHLYLYDRATGEQFDDAEEIRLRLVQPDKKIGPIVHRIPRQSFAHYELRGLSVGVPGTWRIQATVRVSEFDQHDAETNVTFR